MISTRQYQEIRRLSESAIREEVKHGASLGRACSRNRFLEDLHQSLSPGENLNPLEFSFRDLFEHTVVDKYGDHPGLSMLESWNPKKRMGYDGAMLHEAEVSTANFANIMGQIVYSSILPTFTSPTFIGDRLARNIPTPFEQEKIAGISNPGDVTEAIPESHPFPKVGIGEHWIDTQITKKYGAILQMTKEALFFDRTGQLMEQAQKLTLMLAVAKEKRVLDVALGLVDTYRRNGAAAIDGYGDDSGLHNWDNLAASNALVDWTDIENVMLLFDAITDPDTGELVFIDMANMTVVVPTALSATLDQIVNTTEIRTGDITASPAIQMVTSNPRVASMVIPLSNQYVKDRTSSASTWYVGDFLHAVTYRENWPISTPPDAVSDHDEIHNDIVFGVKVTERGAAGMENPRLVAKSTA